MENKNRIEIVSLKEVILSLAKEVIEEKPGLTNGSKQSFEKIRRQIKEKFKNRTEMNFICKKNISMVKFLYEDSINREIYHSSRTYLVLDSLDQHKLLGFFTLAYKQIDISLLDKEDKKKLIYTGKSAQNIANITAYLIAQLCKNELYENSITGKELLLSAISTINNARDIIGGKVIVLDSVNIPKVLSFYSEYGFLQYGEMFQTKDGEELIPMIMNFDDMNLINS